MKNRKASAKSPPLLVEERRRHIVEVVKENGRATVGELAKQFYVSAVTIRGDLQVLSLSGAITRSHGGAIPVAQSSRDTPLSIKETLFLPEKRRIARTAERMIDDGDTIILDSGSTTVEIARWVCKRKWHGLTVITNALNIALELSALANVRVMMLGGLLRSTSYSLAGPSAERELSRLSADRLFLGVDGLDSQVGVTTSDPHEASLNALMIQVSRETIAVLDASKLGRRSLSVIAPISSLDMMITDTGADGDCIKALQDQGLKVLLA